MNQSGKKTMVRATIDMDFELKDTIHKMAQDKNWSFSYMSYVLLQYAIKEKQRKKKGNNERKPGHMGQGNGQ